MEHVAGRAEEVKKIVETPTGKMSRRRRVGTSYNRLKPKFHASIYCGTLLPTKFG